MQGAGKTWRVSSGSPASMPHQLVRTECRSPSQYRKTKRELCDALGIRIACVNDHGSALQQAFWGMGGEREAHYADDRESRQFGEKLRPKRIRAAS
jgi:hypothetical protein